MCISRRVACLLLVNSHVFLRWLANAVACLVSIISRASFRYLWILGAGRHVCASSAVLAVAR